MSTDVVCVHVCFVHACVCVCVHESACMLHEGNGFTSIQPPFVCGQVACLWSGGSVFRQSHLTLQLARSGHFGQADWSLWSS